MLLWGWLTYGLSTLAGRRWRGKQRRANAAVATCRGVSCQKRGERALRGEEGKKKLCMNVAILNKKAGDRKAEGIKIRKNNMNDQPKWQI